MTEKKRVLCYSDFSLAGTGFGVVSKHVIGALHATGKYDIHQLAINFHGDFTDDKEVPWQIRPARLIDPRDPHGTKMFLKAVTKNHYDIVWILNDLFVTHPIAKYISQVREQYIVRNRKPPVFIYYYPVDCHVQAADMLDAVEIPVCYTEHGRAETIKAKPHLRLKLREIPHGVDSSIFKPLSEEEIIKYKKQYLGVDPDTFVVVAVNRNSTRKQLPYSILAFKEFRKLVPNSIMYCHAKVQDQGGDLNRVLADLGLDNKKDVVFPGRYSPSEPVPTHILNRFYNLGDVFLTTHLGEGFGLSVVEAMATGVPIVAPNNTCYRPGTKVFLQDRIDNIENIKIGDKVLSIDPETGNCSYNPVTYTYKLDYEGDLVIMNTQQVKLGVTLDHRVLHSKGRWNNNIVESKAGDMEASIYRLPCYGDMCNWDYDLWFTLPEPQFKRVHKKSQTHKKFDMSDFLSLLGWYITEGCCEKRGYRIRITQCIQENRNEIFALLDRMQIRYTTSGNNINFNHNQLHQVFSMMGTNCYSKTLPRWVFSLHREQLAFLFDAMIKGDGHTCDIYTGFITSSKQLARDFAELCLCMGYTFSIKPKIPQDVVIHGRLIPKENQSLCWFVRVNNPKQFVQLRNCQGTQKARKQDLTRQSYKGKVFCVTVRNNSNLFVGENGHFVFSGNCMPQLLGTNSERGYMYTCKDKLWIDLSGFREKGLIPDIVEQLLKVHDAGPKQTNPVVSRARAWTIGHDWKIVTQDWVKLFEELDTTELPQQPVVSQEV